MKIRIDMQGVQTASRHRGIGRYCLSVTREFAELAAPDHQVSLIFNAALEGIDEAIGALGTHGVGARRSVFGPVRHTARANPANDGRRVAAERIFNHALDNGAPDVIWLSSVIEGFSDDALMPSPAPESFTVATLYDLIPLHDPSYLGQGRARDWYFERLDALKSCDLLLAISEWVRDDAIEHLHLDPSRIIVIGAGVESHFAPPESDIDHTEVLRATYGIDRPFIMYNGGFDKRKNVTALIGAFSDLPADTRLAHQLVIVGQIDDLIATQFAEAIGRLGLRADSVIFPGFVSDADLVRLYQTCTLFVFPSESEGFGLAPLEAMACGAATIVNRATSLPEVVGDPEATFDASTPGAMTTKIHELLSRPELAQRLRENGLVRAAHFTWRAVAERALGAIEAHAGSGSTGKPAAVATAAQLIVDATQARLEAPLATHPLYKLDATNVTAMLPWIRRWPGSILWSGPLPINGLTDAADRYRLGGYAAILDTGTGSDWLRLMEQEGFSVRRLDTDTPLTDDMLARAIGDVCANPNRTIVRQRHLEDSIAQDVACRLNDDDLARVADAIDRLRPSGPLRWLVDVTAIAHNDLGTGIQRVVRSILREWLARPPEGVRIEPIAFRNGQYHHAHTYACTLLGIHQDYRLPGDIVSVTARDVFVGLDWAIESLSASETLLKTWRRAGVPIHFVVHDLLPVTLPDAFHPYTRKRFAAWLASIATVADALHCVSHSTANELECWLDKQAPANQFGTPPLVSSFRLGVEPPRPIESKQLSCGLERSLATRPSLLMVGTLEPRKGHRQALDAVELLWEGGTELNLVIVGHCGWMMKDMTDRLSRHPEIGKRLFWLDNADDSVLEALYTGATALLAPSRGEGFGLPLVEAAHRGLPVIARSLPVFHEVVGDYPSYFDSKTAEGLATYLAKWLVDRPVPGRHEPWASWRESANTLEHAIWDLGTGTRPRYDSHSTRQCAKSQLTP